MIDPVLILGILLVLPALASRRWRWPLAVGWTISAVVLGGFSSYLLVVTVGAGLLLVLHPAQDRVVRMVSVGAQAVLQVAMLIWAQRSTDLAEIATSMEGDFDGHLTFYANPVRMAQELHLHARRVAEIYPGGSGRWLTVLFAAAVLGLVIAAFEQATSRGHAGAARVVRSGRRRGGCPVRAVPVRHHQRRPGLVGRPPQHVAHPDDRGRPGRPGRAPAGALVHASPSARPSWGSAWWCWPEGRSNRRFAYPFPGSASASAYVEDELEEGDVVLVTQTSIYAFLITTDLPATLAPSPERMIGFTPVYGDRRIRTMGAFGEVPLAPEAVEALVARADRVFVHGSIGDFGGVGNLDPAAPTGRLRANRRASVRLRHR